MPRPSIFAPILFLLLLLSSVAIAQQPKQWSFGGALGSSTQLSLSYKVNPQWQLSFVLGPYGDLARTTSDRIGLSAIYYLDTSDTPLFVGFAPGITAREPHSFIAVVPFGIQHKITDDFSIRLGAELFVTTNELHRTAGGIGISIGGSVSL
jgi:hypothetical protein